MKRLTLILLLGLAGCFSDKKSRPPVLNDVVGSWVAFSKTGLGNARIDVQPDGSVWIVYQWGELSPRSAVGRAAVNGSKLTVDLSGSGTELAKIEGHIWTESLTITLYAKEWSWDLIAIPANRINRTLNFENQNTITTPKKNSPPR